MKPTADLLRVHAIGWQRAGLRELSFALAPGEFLSVLGPAGAGKSALLAILAGLAVPDRGEIHLGGMRLARTPTHRRGIGVVFDGGNLFDHMTVAQNIALPLRARTIGTRERRHRVTEMLDRMQLRDVAAERPSALSILGAHRAALARATIAAPRLLLLDDPFAGCDPEPRALLVGDVRRLKRELGFGVVMASRNAADARVLSDRIAVLLDGTIAQAGSAGTLYDRPVSAAVAGLMGETNRLGGVVRAIEDDVVAVALDCGPVVEAGLADASAIGQRCLVLVRPERVALAAISAAELGAGAIPAIVQDMVDMGDHIRLTLAAGDTRIIVRRPAGAALAGLAPGRAVAIAWQPLHAWACGTEQGSEFGG